MKLAVLLALALAACSKDKPAAPIHGSCQASPVVCEDYESTDAKYIARQRDACKGVGTWTDAPCPTGSVAGSCRESHGWTRTRRHYHRIEGAAPGQANPVVEKAKAECGAYGTWIEPSP